MDSGFKDRIRLYARTVRMHQQVKNLLVFVPMFTAHKINDSAVVVGTTIAFVCFCLCASSGYVLNDLLDRQSDRLHPSKSRRPLASGELSVFGAVMLIPSLAVAAFALALLLPRDFLVTLAFYYALTICYSLWLKQIAMGDVVILAALYTLRIVAGLTAASLSYSFWLLAFSVFLFLSLAFVKRYTELIYARNGRDADSFLNRGYEIRDIELISSLGAASGYIAVLLLALYLHSHEVVRLYDSPKVLWILCPILLYWISRVWLLTHRGKMHDDPILFALTDRTSLLTALMVISVIIAAV